MQTSSPPFPATKTESKADSDQTLGFAVYGLPDACNFLAAGILEASLKQEMQRAGVVWTEYSSMCVPTHIVILITLASRDPGLKLLQAQLMALRIIFFQAAYFDRAELIWRTVHPPGFAHFEHLLAPEQFTAAKEYCQKISAPISALNAFLESAARLPVKETPPENPS
jgi:hypothetical protein